MKQFSLTKQAAWVPRPCHSMAKHISSHSSGSPSKPTAKNHGSQESHLAAPLPDFIVFGNPPQTSANYVDRKAFKNMLLIIQVPGQEPHTVTCGTND